LTSDACPVNYTGANLASEMHAAGRTFELFAEQLPSDDSTSCYASADGNVTSGYLYWRKHDPAADFPFVSSTETQPWIGTSTNYGAADVSFIVPNICDDMHDCGVAAGDRWASQTIPAIESYNAAHNGLLILTFDEGDYDSTNHIVTIFDGLGLHGQSTQNITHYSLLRYIEDTFGLPRLGYSAGATAISFP
jgi:acid phosphatase